MKETDLNVIKKIKEQIRKQDKSIKLMFLPDRFAIGGLMSKLANSLPMLIQINARNKLCLRFQVAANPVIGYKETDVGLALTFIDSISMVDEENGSSPVIMFTLTAEGFEKFCQSLPGLKHVVENSSKGKNSYARNLTFLLSPFDEEMDSFVQIQYADREQSVTEGFNFDVAKKIFQEDISRVWNQYNSEKVVKRKGTSTIGNRKLIQDVAYSRREEWFNFLFESKLHSSLNKYRRTGINGNSLKTSENEWAKTEKVNLDNDDKYSKKRKIIDENLCKEDCSLSSHQKNTRRQSTASPAPAKDKRQIEMALKAMGEDNLLMFPRSGHHQCIGMEPVPVLVKDVRTLDRKEFVNDIVMSFMLNYIRFFMMDKDMMNKVYISSTFFYSKLTKQLPPLCFSGRRPISSDHEAILLFNAQPLWRWTKSFDIFEKEFLVIPVNEDLHWMMIAIVNPAGAIVDMTDEKRSRSAPNTYIVYFDPLSGLDPSKRNHMCYCINRYLLETYKKTKTPGGKFATNYPTTFDASRIIVTRAKNTPIQNNFSDCGLYVLHFVEGLFCCPKRPVTVNDFPGLDWSKLYPEAIAMCDLMRDKVYNLILQQCDQGARSRLAEYESACNVGLSREGESRKSRRHSAANIRRTPRHHKFHPRFYSLNPPNRNVMNEDPAFTNPRVMALMPTTQKVRKLKIPEENFPITY